MPAIVNFGYFEVQELDNSEINMGEVVTLTPFLSLKRNDGYGFNIGEWKYVPSASFINDADVFDNPRWIPNWRPTGAGGS